MIALFKKKYWFNISFLKPIFQNIMRNLVRRYVTVEQRKSDNQGVTEDDVNEIKQDISAFRCELIEVLKNSGMNTSTATGVGQGISFGSIRGKLSISSYYYFPLGVALASALSPVLVALFLSSHKYTFPYSQPTSKLPLCKLRNLPQNVCLFLKMPV